MEVDVAIVGAGPAGSALAALVASRGASVALIDRDTFPRDKLCGEFLSYDALPILELLGVDIDRSSVPQITRCRVVGEKHVYEFDLPSAARGVSRLLFDDLLVRNAREEGAHVLSGRSATRLEGGAVILEDGERVAGRVVVGAWGRWGRFDHQLERGFVRNRANRHFGFKRHFRSLSPREQTIDLYSFRRGYLGVNSIEGGRTNICGLVHADRIAGLRGGWEEFTRNLREESAPLSALFSGHEPAQEEFLSCEPAIFLPRQPLEGEIVMVGDAAGLIDPLTGNGMAMALQSALLAGPFVLARLAGRSAAGYPEAHARLFSSRIRWSRRIAALLTRPRLLRQALRLHRWQKPGTFLLRQTRADGLSLGELLRHWKQA
jgi:menaquinone-9 beta-reductase